MPVVPHPRQPGPDESAGPVVRFVRRRPVLTFLLWFFTVGQVFAFVPVVARANGADWPVQPWVIASTMIGLLLPAAVITRVVDGPDALRALARRSVDVRIRWPWYLLTLVAMPALTLALAVALLGPPAGTSAATWASAIGAGLLLQAVLCLVPNNLCEEVAWTGFVQARLQARWTPVRAAVVTAPLFALQHIALVVGNSVAVAVVLMTFLTVVSVPFRMFVGWLFNRTGSLFLVGLVHAVGNAAAAGSGFGESMLRRLYAGSDNAGVMHLLAFAVLGVVVVLATRGRLGRDVERPLPPPRIPVARLDRPTARPGS